MALDRDVIWFDEDGGYGETFAEHLADAAGGGYWLRLCANVHQSGVPVLPFAGGLGLPEWVEDRPESRYFPGVEYLALTCDPGE